MDTTPPKRLIKLGTCEASPARQPHHFIRLADSGPASQWCCQFCRSTEEEIRLRLWEFA